MSYTELEHGYQDLRSTSRPIFYVGDLNAVPPSLVDSANSSLYRSSKRGELSDGCSNEDGCMGGSDLEGEGKQVLVGVCAMAKKSQSKPMKEILTRLEEFEYIKIVVFPEEVILKEPVEDWPIVDCLISFHSKGFPLDKAIHYANLRNPFNINNLPMQYDIQDRRRVYAILDGEGIEIPRYAVLDRDSADPKHHELVESEDHVEVNGVTFNKPFVEKPVSAEDHNIYIYYPTCAGGGSQRLFRKIGSRSSVYSPESRVRKTGSYIYEDFMPTDGTDVKVYTVGPDYAHAEARKSPALDGKVERDSEGKEIRYPVILSNAEKLISRKVCLAFKQTVCGFDLLRANGKSFVCDVNGFSFVKNSNKYYDDCAKILGNMILRELAPTLHIPWSVPFQLDDPPIVPTTFGKMMELRCVVAVIRHGDRTPKQKMKVEVRHPKFFEIFAKYDGYKHGHVKLKRPKQLQEILDTARSLLTEIQHRAAGPELEEKQGKLEQLKSVLEMYGHFSGINRKVQMKYQPRGRPRGSSSDDGNSHNRLGEPSLVLILKWGGELTPAGRIQAEELGRIFRCMYPGGQGRHLSEEDSEMLPSHGEYAGAQGLGLLRLHSTFRHDLKIYASDEGRVQMTAAAFAKGLLALEGELTPILVQMVKSANTNGLLDNDCDSSKYQNMVKTRLHELLQQDREFTREDREQINPGNAISINDALDFVKNPVKCCQHVQVLIQKLMDIVRIKKDDPKTKDAILYHGETWELMGRRWGKIEKDFCTKNKRFDISKIPDIYDCIKYDLQHNNHTLQFDHAEELYIYAKYLADIVIPQEYGLTQQEKMTIGQGICTPLLKKIRADLQRNIEESGEETVNRLNPRYSHGVSSPGRHVRTRLYFTSESHVHSLLTVLRYGGLLDVVKDEQWRRAMEYVSMVSELNYMSQIVVMLYEDPTKDPSSEERFHVELHFSPGVNCCVQKNLPPGPGFRPHSRNESSHNLETNSQCSTRIDEEDVELTGLDDSPTSPQPESSTSPVLVETEEAADSTLDSPTTSRAIDMMDLDPNMMDEPYDSGFLQASAPIPISARTVAGHEAARLGSQLAASQRQRRERDASGICEPRARSYDHQRQEKADKTVEKLQYQSLDAVNKEDSRESNRRFDLDDLFYDRVESLVTSKNRSTSQNCLGTSSNSLYSSSPDLSTNFTAAEQEKRRIKERQVSQLKSRAIGRPNLPKLDYALPKPNREETEDFWDFSDTQLLENSPILDEKEISQSPKEYKLAEEALTWKNVSNEAKKSSESPERISAPKNQSSNKIKLAKSKSIPVAGKNDPDDLLPIATSEIIYADVEMKPNESLSKELLSSAKNSSDEGSPKIGIEIIRASGQKLVMTRSPGCLGIPVTLPHSVSSPELPVPAIVTILDGSSPPVVQQKHDSPLTPLNLSTARSRPFESTEKTDRTSLNSSSRPISLKPSMPQATSETKRYGRSISALTLTTGNDPRGEWAHPKIPNFPRSDPAGFWTVKGTRSQFSNSKCQSCNRNNSNNWKYSHGELHQEGSGLCIKGLPPNFCNRRASFGSESRSASPLASCGIEEPKFSQDYSSSLPTRLQSPCRRMSLEVPPSFVPSDFSSEFYSNFRRTSLTLSSNQEPPLRSNERSRSLSPSPQRCLCYNCNVSALIRQSVNLPPAERSNFEKYFFRSLSHKFINCCCYQKSIESARMASRVSRSASPNFSTNSEASNPVNLSCTRSLPCLDLRSCRHGKNNRFSSLEAWNSRRSSPQKFGSLPNDSLFYFKLRETDAVDHSPMVDSKEALIVPHVEKLSANNLKDDEKILDKTLNDEYSNIAIGSLKIINDKNVEMQSANPNFSLKIRQASMESNKVSSVEKMYPAADVIEKDPSTTISTNYHGSLPRQSSCPEVVTGHPNEDGLKIDCDCENCGFIKKSSAKLKLSKNRFNNVQSVARFLSPNRKPQNLDTHYFFPRKFSCPEIIIESANPEVPQSEITEDDRTLRLFYPSSVIEGKSNRINEETEVKETSTILKSKKAVPRQISCPEMMSDYSTDVPTNLLSHRLLLAHEFSSSKFSKSGETCAQCLVSIATKTWTNESPLCHECTANQRRKPIDTPCKYPTNCYPRFCLKKHDRNDYYSCYCHGSRETQPMTNLFGNAKIQSIGTRAIHFDTLYTTTSSKHPRLFSSSLSTTSSHRPRLQTQRSFSSPDTRPSIIQQPDPTCTARRHRHSISGQMSYFKLLGYNVSKKLTGSANSLFSTAVISGSSSAPNLKDMVPQHASAVAAIEGFGGVPPIRPLETLHNALSLRQLDSFLDMMTNASLFRTPASSPPKFPSPGGSIHGGSAIPNLSIENMNREYHSSDLEAVRYIAPTAMHYKSGQDSESNDNRNQLSPTSPNSAGWSSEPQSFLSSGPCSPAPTSAGECSMSMSLVSNDGTQPFAVGTKYSTTPSLNIGFNDFCRNIDQQIYAESRGSISYTDYYSNEDGLIRKSGPDLSNLRERVAQDEMSQEAIVDEDEEHTLTLRETEEQPKQDVKFIFDQGKDGAVGAVKPSSSFKKIGRFRVESMEISEEDVRIRGARENVDPRGSNLSLDQPKAVSNLDKFSGISLPSSESQDSKKFRANFSTPQNRSRPRAKTIARSQSVSTPQSVSRNKADLEEMRKTSGKSTGSFSTMSCEDLENWKLIAASPSTSNVTSPSDMPQEEPILVVASNFNQSSNVTIGFNIQHDKQEN